MSLAQLYRTTGVKMKSNSQLRNQKGLATVETLAILLVFVILLSYSLGVFGVIHTGILNSIAARTYAFETFRNRANLTYFRDIPTPALLHFRNFGNRIHGVKNERDNTSSGFRSTERPLRVGFGGIPSDSSRSNPNLHNTSLFQQVNDGVTTQVGVSPVWIMTQYGICLDAWCGG